MNRAEAPEWKSCDAHALVLLHFHFSRFCVSCPMARSDVGNSAPAPCPAAIPRDRLATGGLTPSSHRNRLVSISWPSAAVFVQDQLEPVPRPACLKRYSACSWAAALSPSRRTLYRSAIPGWHIARFRTPTTTNARLGRRPAAPGRHHAVFADPPVSAHRSAARISTPSRRGRARSAPPCARTPTVRSIRTPQATPPAPRCLPRPAGTAAMRTGCPRIPGSAPAPAP